MGARGALVRVIGGVWHGRRLKAPAGRATRPTSDRVREAIFDVLEARLGPADTRQEVGPQVTGAEAGPHAAREEAGPHAASAEAGPQMTREGAGAQAARQEAGPNAADAGLPLAGHRVLDLFAGMGGLGIEALSRGAASCTFVEHDEAALRALRANLRALSVGAARGRVHAADYRRALAADVRAGRRYTLVFVDPPYAEYAAVEADLQRVLVELLAPGAVVVVETARAQAVVMPLVPVQVKRYGDTQVTFLEAARTPAPAAGRETAAQRE